MLVAGAHSLYATICRCRSRIFVACICRVPTAAGRAPEHFRQWPLAPWEKVHNHEQPPTAPAHLASPLRLATPDGPNTRPSHRQIWRLISCPVRSGPPRSGRRFSVLPFAHRRHSARASARDLARGRARAMLAMLLEKEPRHSAHSNSEPEADYASIAEGSPRHLEFAKRLYVGVREAAGLDGGRRFTRHLVGNHGLRQPIPRPWHPGIDRKCSKKWPIARLSCTFPQIEYRGKWLKISRRV